MSDITADSKECHMRVVYFEDLKEGDVFRGDEMLVDPEEMLACNRQNDPWPFHRKAPRYLRR